jgi:hypothetical protein
MKESQWRKCGEKKRGVKTKKMKENRGAAAAKELKLRRKRKIKGENENQWRHRRWRRNNSIAIRKIMAAWRSGAISAHAPALSASHGCIAHARWRARCARRAANAHNRHGASLLLAATHRRPRNETQRNEERNSIIINGKSI